jgi:hypothetical protein
VRSERIGIVLVALVPASCLLNWDSLREPDGGFDASGDDVTTDTFVNEASTNDVGDAGSDANPPCDLQVTINEVKADGVQGPSDEFVELRNSASCGGSLLNWTLRYSSAGGSSPSQLWIGQAGDTIGPAGPDGYVILGGFAFQAPDGGNLIGRISTDLNGSLSKTGGGVGLFGPPPNVPFVDGVAYETLTTQTHPFIQPGDAGSTGGAPNPPSGKSIARTPDGHNTGTSATDFQIATPTPGFSN